MCYMHYKMDCCCCPVVSESTTVISTSLENVLFPKKKRKKENVYRGLTDRGRGLLKIFKTAVCGLSVRPSSWWPSYCGDNAAQQWGAKNVLPQGVMCSFYQTHFPWKYSDPSRRWKITWDELRLSFLCTFWNPHHLHVLMPQARFEICQFLFLNIFFFKNYLVTDL